MYWICTICMLIECFVLFVIVVTPAVLRFPEEYEFLKGQEIFLFILAVLQLIVMSLGVYMRKTLANNDTKKTLWAATIFVLSFITLAISWKNIGMLRELTVFIMALI